MKRISLLAVALIAFAPAGPAEEPAEPSVAVEVEAEDDVPNRHERPIITHAGRTLVWAGEDDQGNVEWFDVTGSHIDPERLQFGIGKDTIDSVDDPVFVDPDDRLLAKRGVTPLTPVLGVELNGIARAYPVSLMALHEVVNDDFAGEPYAVLW